MVRIIVSATLVVLLAVLVAFNLRFTTSFSIYGAEFTGVPVMVIALLSFALGVVYSLLIYVGRYIGLRRSGTARSPRGGNGRSGPAPGAVSLPASDPPRPAAAEEPASQADPPPSPRRRWFRRRDGVN